MRYDIDPAARIIGMGLLHTAHGLAILKEGPSSLYEGVLQQLGMDHPDADTLAILVCKAKRNGISRAEMREIGWVRLRLIMPHLNTHNSIALTSLAKTLPVGILARILNCHLDTPSIHVLRLRLSPEQWSWVSRALITCGAGQTQNGLAGAEDALVKALAPWAGMMFPERLQ